MFLFYPRWVWGCIAESVYLKMSLPQHGYGITEQICGILSSVFLVRVRSHSRYESESPELMLVTLEVFLGPLVSCPEKPELSLVPLM